MPAMDNIPPPPAVRPNRPVYLDNQATTRCDPRVLAVMLPFFSEEYGNAHSAEHVMGHRAEAAVEAARAEVAALIGADPQGSGVHLRRDGEQQHRHQGRGPACAPDGRSAPAHRDGGDRA